MAKTVGQWVGTIVGAVVGYFSGGTSYVALGAAVGGAVGGAIDPPKGPAIFGPRLDDLKIQTATYGAVKPRVYGTTVVSGNVFWIEGDALREVTTKEKHGGKGGGGQETTTYSYYATFAVGICKGPILGVRRMWIGDDLVYSGMTAADSGASADLVAESLMASWGGGSGGSVKWTLYYGSDTQQPDPRMEADKGAGNVSGYPGDAYIVIEDLNLGKWSNTLARAQVKVEVVTGTIGISGVSTVIDSLAVKGDAIQDVFLRSFTFDLTGADYAIQTRSYTSGAAKEIWWGRKEFPYSEKKSIDSIYSVDGGWGYAYGFLNVMQTDEQILVSWQTPTMYSSDTKLRFFRPGSNTGWLNYSTSPLSSFSYTICCIDNGEIFVSGPGLYVAAVNGFDYAYGSAATWNAASIGVSENFVFVLLDTASAYQTIVKFDRADLSWISTTTETTGSPPHSMTVISDTLIYTSSIRAGYNTNQVHKWVNLAIVRDITEGFTNSGSVPDAGSRAIKIIDDDPVSGYHLTNIYNFTTYAHDICLAGQVIDDTPAKLRGIVTAECALGGIDASDLALSSLVDSDVRGFKIAAVAAVRSGFDPLQAAWPFDCYQAGYKVKFVTRGGSSITSIDETDLGTTGKSDAILLPVIREMDSQLPSKVSVIFHNAAREYDTDEQYAERLNVHSVSERRVELAIVLTPEEAAQIADVLLAKDWLERTTLGPFSLPPTFGYLEPCDVITISHRGASYSARLTRIEYHADGSMDCSAVLSSSATYTSTALGATSAVTSYPLLSLPGLTELYLLDIPRIRSEQDSMGLVFGMLGQANGWPGATLLRSDDSGATWQAIGNSNSRTDVFSVPGTLGASTSYAIDSASVLSGVAPLFAGMSLYSVTESGLYAHSNLAAYGDDGRWEIIAFKTTVDNTGSFTLTDFLRGLYGTEAYTGTHVAGDLLIMLSGVDWFGLPTNTLGSPRPYRAVTQGAMLDSASDEINTYGAISFKPLSPVDLRGHRDPTTFDWTLIAVRRTRTPVELFSGATVPLGETSEQYEVEIWDSGYTTLKRTITGLTTISVPYSSVDQITDFGANQSSLYVKIYQMSSVVGRGYPLISSITRLVTSDPFAAQVKLLMWCSTDFSDVLGHTATPYSGASVTGGWAVFDGVDDYLLLDGASDLFPGTGDFTFELRVYPLSLSRFIILRDDRPNATNGDYIALYINTDGSIDYFVNYAVRISAPAGTIVINNEYHIAISRLSGYTRMFVDGTQAGTTYTDSTNYLTAASRPTIIGNGADIATTTYRGNAKIKDIRYTASGRYSSNFTPPASPLPDPTI